MAAEIGQNEFSTWFSRSALLASDEESVTIGLPNAFVLTAVQRKHGQCVERAVAECCGRALRVEFKTIGRSGKLPQLPTPAARVVAQPTTAMTTPVAPTLRSQYTLQDFVVGPENQLAHAVACAVADGRSKYNPLFVHGPCGVGKTHLLRAIADAAGDRHVVYATTEQFTNQLVSALRQNSPSKLRGHFRTAELLLIDDVYFVAGKKATQEELFHTFDAVAANGGGIVLASDRTPAEMDELPDRLRSRFASGIVVDIEPPGYELRLAYINHLVRRAETGLPDTICTALASIEIGDLRKLGGMFNRLIAEHQLKGIDPSLAHVDQLAAAANLEPLGQSIRATKIIDLVANHFQVERSLITGTARQKGVVVARNICVFLIRQLTDESLSAIGSMLGGRSHSTIINAQKRASDQIDRDARLRHSVDRLISRLSG